MTRRIVAGFVLVALAAPVSLSGQSVPLTAGKFEVVISGLPGGQKETKTRCLTPEHLKQAEAVFTYAYSASGHVNPGVKLGAYSVANGHIDYDAETAASRIHVAGTLSATGFSVDRKTTPKSGNGAAVTMHLEGKRVGACAGG